MACSTDWEAPSRWDLEILHAGPRTVLECRVRLELYLGLCAKDFDFLRAIAEVYHNIPPVFQKAIANEVRGPGRGQRRVVVGEGSGRGVGGWRWGLALELTARAAAGAGRRPPAHVVPESFVV